MRMLEFVDGKSTFDELFSLARRMKVSSRLDINKFMGAALVVPESIDKLEASIPGISITRFPKSPYGILRVYWENMHSVRESVREICAEKDSIPSKDAFRILHVIALMGSDLCSFYKPDSPVSDEAVWPGHYRRRKTEVSYQGVLEFNWHLSAVARSLKIDFEFPYEVKWVERNTHWGKGYIDEHSAHYSAPPPPFNKQTESLHEAFLHLPRRVTTEKLEEAICKLAKFHQRFVQLHPFECANQSLAMNIVNNFLGEWMNSCIPHLFLDMFSLFLSPDDYARLFGRAVKYYSVRNEHTRDAYRSLGERFKSMRAFVPTFLTADQFKSAREIEEENSQVACDLLLQD
ncbi:MAG TPA: Fic family protein [Methylocella sp.]|nr:Fic family protein [Methylocella sp.]